MEAMCSIGPKGVPGDFGLDEELEIVYK